LTVREHLLLFCGLKVSGAPCMNQIKSTLSIQSEQLATRSRIERYIGRQGVDGDDTAARDAHIARTLRDVGLAAEQVRVRAFESTRACGFLFVCLFVCFCPVFCAL
jgi:DUF1365 family protein